MPRFDQLLLPFGLGLAALTFVYWTSVGFARYGRWTSEGVLRAAFVLGAVGAFALVLRLAQWLDERNRP